MIQIRKYIELSTLKTIVFSWVQVQIFKFLVFLWALKLSRDSIVFFRWYKLVLCLVKAGCGCFYSQQWKRYCTMMKVGIDRIRSLQLSTHVDTVTVSSVTCCLCASVFESDTKRLRQLRPWVPRFKWRSGAYEWEQHQETANLSVMAVINQVDSTQYSVWIVFSSSELETEFTQLTFLKADCVDPATL